MPQPAAIDFHFPMTRILMCGSTLDTKGGMVSVIKNYLEYADWGEYRITYIPTHFDANKYVLICYFCIRYMQIVISALFGRYRIAHLHVSFRGSFWRKAFLAKTLQAMGTKVIMHHHGSRFEEFYAACSDRRKARINKILESVDLNIVLGGHLIKAVKEKAPAARVAVLYNAVRTYAENPYNDKAKYVLHLGRLGERKGTFDLLTAIKKLDASIDEDIRFLLCGDGAVEEVGQRVQEYGIAHRIGHIGWIGKKRKEQLLSQTMISVLPSYNEGLPMSILETMAYGIPNISTPIAAIPEIIRDGGNGFLIMPGDTDALSRKLYSLIVNPDLRKRFSSASYESIAGRFALRNNVEELKRLYADFIS